MPKSQVSPLPLLLNRLAPLFIGLATFLLIMGWRPLNVAAPQWFPSNDPVQGWLGWAFFRQSPWSVPLGLNPAYGLEMGNSIVYTDSIPLLALIFKPFSPLLPEYFQYAGIWLLACFILQAWFGWKLISIYTPSYILRGLVCVLFTFSPILLCRLSGHFTLVGQFLILAALCLCLERNKELNNGRNRQQVWHWLKWQILLCVCALTHGYFLAMCGILWLADIADRDFSSGDDFNARNAIVQAAVTIPLVWLCCWQAGYFVISPGGQGGYGYYKMNLLALIDANDTSRLFPDLINATEWEHEGFNFLGAGNIALFVFSLAPILAGKSHLLKRIQRRWGLFSALAFMALFAVTYNINIGSWEIILPQGIFFVLLFSICLLPVFIYARRHYLNAAYKKRMPGWLIIAASICIITALIVMIYGFAYFKPAFSSLIQNFRSSGRFFWPVYYMLVLSMAYIIINCYGKKAAVVLLSCAVFIQIADSAPWWMKFSQYQNQFIQASRLALPSPFWEKAALKYDKIRTLSFVNMGNSWEVFGPYAARYGLGTDLAYFSRYDEKKLARINELNERMVERGEFAPDTFYIVNGEIFNKARQTVRDKTTLMEKIDGFYVIAPRWNIK